MKYFKKSIILSIVPVFVLAGCSNNEDQARLAVPNNNSEVVVNKDGSYSQDGAVDSENKLLASYDEAKSKGYTGSMDDWISLVQLHETNPEQAQAKAEESGFSGSEMLMGALAGAAIGALLGSSSGSRSGLASNSYSAQRYNNTNNYAYSRPKDEEQNSSSGGGYVGRGSSSGSAVAAVAARPKTSTSTPTSSYSTSNSTASSYSSSRSTASYGSVSRGGFGGAVSSGG